MVWWGSPAYWRWCWDWFKTETVERPCHICVPFCPIVTCRDATVSDLEFPMLESCSYFRHSGCRLGFFCLWTIPNPLNGCWMVGGKLLARSWVVPTFGRSHLTRTWVWIQTWHGGWHAAICAQNHLNQVLLSMQSIKHHLTIMNQQQLRQFINHH